MYKVIHNNPKMKDFAPGETKVVLKMGSDEAKGPGRSLAHKVGLVLSIYKHAELLGVQFAFKQGNLALALSYRSLSIVEETNDCNPNRTFKREV